MIVTNIVNSLWPIVTALFILSLGVELLVSFVCFILSKFEHDAVKKFEERRIALFMVLTSVGETLVYAVFYVLAIVANRIAAV